MSLKIGLQLYTLRNEAAKDFVATIEKVAKTGYQGIEFAGYHNNKSSEIKKILDSNGLLAVGSHVGIDAFLNEYEKTVEYLLELGVKYVSIPGLHGDRLADYESTVKTAKQMNQIAEKTRKNGISLSFHNHTHEFLKTFEGKTIHQIFFDEAPLLNFELDSGWSAAAGVDNVSYIKKLDKRLDIIHIKDIGGSDGHTPVEICTGTVDVKSTIAAAKAVGVTWGVVEQDTMKAYPDFESIKISFENIAKINP